MAAAAADRTLGTMRGRVGRTACPKEVTISAIAAKALALRVQELSVTCSNFMYALTVLIFKILPFCSSRINY